MDENFIKIANYENTKKYRISKTGFTLAEILITLGVIGVVAAMTMPTLIQHHQKQATVVQLKKAYSEIAQALQKAENEYGLMETWNFADFDTAFERGTYFGENYIFPHIKTIKKCSPSSSECWADEVVALSGVKETELANTNESHMSFVTSGGYSVYYWVHKNGSGSVYYVDVNGLKAPNKVGKDIFYFQANWGNTPNKKQGLWPYGLHTTTNYTRESMLDGVGFLDKNRACKKGSHYYNGGACAAVIMLDGWKIKDNYPW